MKRNPGFQANWAVGRRCLGLRKRIGWRWDVNVNVNGRCEEKRLSLFEFYNADEVFCTGTMCGLAPVSYVDGRQINPNNPQYPGNITSKLQGEYVKLTQDESYGVKIVV